MAKELLPVVLRLKAWRAQNDISQAEAAELLCRRGLPIRLRTLQESRASIDHLGTISLTWSFRPRCTNFVAAQLTAMDRPPRPDHHRCLPDAQKSHEI